MAGFKLPKPKSSKDAATFLRIGKNLSRQAPTNIFNPKKKKAGTRLPGGKRPR